MTTAKQLFSLQELDLVLDRISKATKNAERELNASRGMEALEAVLEEQTTRLEQIRSQQKTQQEDLETQRERSTRLDDQLYGGSVTNPRDLESLEPEASNARQTLERLDGELVELSARADGPSWKTKSKVPIWRSPRWPRSGRKWRRYWTRRPSSSTRTSAELRAAWVWPR